MAAAENVIRFCPSCGTETDDSALFCPSCGQPIDDTSAADGQPPPPPASLDREPNLASADTEVAAMPVAQRPTGTAPPPQFNVPVTRPALLSAWLIGGGALVAALGALIGLLGGFLNAIDLILLVAFIAIAATVFFSASLPAIPNLQLGTLVIVLISFGVAVDRIGFGRAGIGTLLVFLGTAAAAIGAMILELGHDQPLGGRGS